MKIPTLYLEAINFLKLMGGIESSFRGRFRASKEWEEKPNFLDRFHESIR